MSPSRLGFSQLSPSPAPPVTILPKHLLLGGAWIAEPEKATSQDIRQIHSAPDPQQPSTDNPNARNYADDNCSQKYTNSDPDCALIPWIVCRYCRARASHDPLKLNGVTFAAPVCKQGAPVKVLLPLPVNGPRAGQRVARASGTKQPCQHGERMRAREDRRLSSSWGADGQNQKPGPQSSTKARGNSCQTCILHSVSRQTVSKDSAPG